MRAAIDKVTTVVMRMDLYIGVCQVGGELTNDLFQYILNGDDALDIAILVHDHANALFLLLKVKQQGLQ